MKSTVKPAPRRFGLDARSIKIPISSKLAWSRKWVVITGIPHSERRRFPIYWFVKVWNAGGRNDRLGHILKEMSQCLTRVGRNGYNID